MTTYASCPTAIIDASIEVVWNLLTDPAGWGDFFDLRILSVEPPGKAAVGQRGQGESGPAFLHLKVGFEFTAIDAASHHLGIRFQLPLGIRVQEELDCLPVAEKQCRVNYHCNFDLPSGWRGWIVHQVLRRELDEGPKDSLARLRQAAEHRGAVQRDSR